MVTLTKDGNTVRITTKEGKVLWQSIDQFMNGFTLDKATMTVSFATSKISKTAIPIAEININGVSGITTEEDLGTAIGDLVKMDATAAGGGGTQDLESVLDEGNDADGFKITTLGDATNPQDAMNLRTTEDMIGSALVGLIDDRGNFDASGNAFPTTGGSGTAGAILKGDLWFISVPGVLNSVNVEVGDQIRALVDSPTDGNWAITEANLGFVPENTTNKATDLSSNDDTHYPTTKAVEDALLSKEDTVNKSTDLSSNDDTHYPTTKAVTDSLAGTGSGSLVHATGPTLSSPLISNIVSGGKNQAVPSGADGTLNNSNDGGTGGGSLTFVTGDRKFNYYHFTAATFAFTVSAPSGTPVNNNRVTFRFRDNGTARAITWDVIFRASSDGPALPTTTIVNKTMYLEFIYNSTAAKWDLLYYKDNF